MGDLIRCKRCVEKWMQVLCFLILCGPASLRAEATNVLTHLSPTTLTGYVDTSALWSFGAPAGYAQAGTLRHNDKWEIGAVFDNSVDTSTALDPASYSVSSSAIESLRYVPEIRAVVLTATNLLPTGNSLTITGLKNTAGDDLAPLNLTFPSQEMSWVEIGTGELNFRGEAIGVGESGYDLISGGIELWNLYDEATFVYKEVAGNFDAKIRVESQEPSSRWARAGLMVREELDENKRRPSDPTVPSQGFSRYIDLHVNPVTQADGSAANNLHEVSVRYYTGGIGRSPFTDPTESPTLSNNEKPAYPNAWLRIRRAGQSFTTYRSTNGTDWIELGSFTFPSTTHSGEAVPPLPATLFVGPVYSPENGNITSNPSLRRSFLAQFRDFSVEASAAPATLSVRKVGAEVEITWTETGILQRSETLEPGSWTDLNGVGSPYRTSAPPQKEFYRLKQ